MKIKCNICEKEVPKRKLAKVRVRVMYLYEDFTLRTCKNCYKGDDLMITGFSETLQQLHKEVVNEIIGTYGLVKYKEGYDGP